MATSTLGSILLGSADPQRLRDWYRAAFAVEPNTDGFLELGGVAHGPPSGRGVDGLPSLPIDLGNATG